MFVFFIVFIMLEKTKKKRQICGLSVLAEQEQRARERLGLRVVSECRK